MNIEFFNSEHYFEYLLNNFNYPDIESSQDEFCNRPDAALSLQYIREHVLNKDDQVLEIGCGLGRLISLVQSENDVVGYGLEVSNQAVEMARMKSGLEPSNILHGVAENIPFDSNKFDFVICWGVFDLVDQGRVLSEIIRVLKIGGEAIITGKNDRFLFDDKEAKIAEIKSREKGIPNHYTNYDQFLNAIKLNGAKIIKERFFLRRGDFSQNKYIESKPEGFYEYFVGLRKIKKSDKIVVNFASTGSKGVVHD